MISRKASRRYALGLLGVAKETNVAAGVKTEAIQFNTLWDKSKDLRIFFKSPVIDKKQKIAIVEKIFNTNSLLFTNFLKLVINQGRESGLQQIFVDFITELNSENGIFHAKLTTATPLAQHTIDDIVKNTKSLLNLDCDFELEHIMDKDIIGGYKMRIKDKFVDASLDSKLKSLKKSFTKNQYEANY